jgi:hypothetical protein
MGGLQRLRSAWTGLLWLVRGTGLRWQLQQLENRVRQGEEPSACRLPPPVPADAAVEERLSRVEMLLGQLLARPVAPAVSPLPDLGERLDRLEHRLEQLAGAQGEQARQAQVARWRAIGDLRGFERTISSQNGEDGILFEIFNRIGTRTKFFVEFGVESGVQCNCAYLVRYFGWSGLFLEANPADFARLQEQYREFPSVTCAQAAVTAQNVEQLFEASGVPREIDLLSIDIDGNDYWVWAALQNWRPRVVVIEYNPFYPPPRRWVMKEDPGYVWQWTSYFGASLASLTALAGRKGYTLVGTDSHGVNAFFVRNDCLVPGRFLDPVLHYHYSPFGYNAPAPFEGPFEAV